MTKSDFYKALEETGVDTTNKTHMKIWSMALLKYGKDTLDSKFKRCDNCYYSPRKLGDGTYDLNTCPNNFCLIKSMPNTPAAVVDWLFEQDNPLDLSAFYISYVEPILNELIERGNNARNQNS